MGLKKKKGADIEKENIPSETKINNESPDITLTDSSITSDTSASVLADSIRARVTVGV